jgi:2-C-methyl-D-erythritol 2,4-cyclodiphosphate synthase
MDFRIGTGYDVHRLAEGEELWLGGIKLDYHKGTIAHSDGDVLIHAICDAFLGAVNLRDLGFHFPDISIEFKGIDSKILLAKTYELVNQKGYILVNIDSTLVTQQPKLAPYIPEMKSTLAGVLKVDQDLISIKATTTEKLGFEGREEGISAQAVVLLKRP